VVASTKDSSLRPEYARSLAGWLGMEVAPVMAAVAAVAKSAPRQRRTEAASSGTQGPAAAPVMVDRPRPDDRTLLVDREALKTALQHPGLSGAAFDELPAEAFAHPAYVAVRAAVAGAGGAASGADDTAEVWVKRVLEAAATDAVRSVVTELAVEPLRIAGQPDARYVDQQVGHLGERMVQRRVADVRSRLQRIDPDDAEYQQVFGELVELEQQRRRLRERAAGGA
jgi:DNA primase